MTRAFGTSRFTQVLSLDAGGDRLNVYNDVNWTESRSLLKLAFPLNLDGETARCDAGLGSVERGDRAPGKYEVPVHTWANLYDKDRDYSVTVLNDCKYAMDKCGSVLRLTCIHTPANKFMDETRQDLQDHGQNVWSFAIYGGKGDFRAVRAHRAGTCYNNPLAVCQTGSHGGMLPPTFSFLRAAPETVSVLAVKKAEDGDETVVRVCETAGQPTRAALSFGGEILSAREINGYEQPLGDAVVENGRIVFDLNPFAPKSFAVRLRGPAGEPVKNEYAPLPVAGTVPFTSRNADRGRWGIGEEKVTVPREIITKDFRAADIPFTYHEEDGDFRCLIPAGEQIALPEGTGVLHLVAARSDEDGAYALLTDGRPVAFGVQCFADDIGGWDQIGSGHYGFIREDRVAFCASHVHDVSGDRVYGRFSWYLYSIALPEGTKTVTLPADGGMMIAAITAQRGGERARLVSDIALHKAEKRPHRLTADGHIGGGAYRAGDPVYLIYGGDSAGEVAWTASDGAVYCGLSAAFDMPDRDLSVSAFVRPYARQLPPPCRVIADTAEEGCEATHLTDGRRDTLWRSATDGPAQVLLDLGARKRFSHTVLYHAGVCGADPTRNTFDYTVEYLKDGVWTFLAQAAGNILPVTQHDHEEVRAQFLRISIQTPTRCGNDGRASLAAVECCADGDYGEETEQDKISAYDLIDGLRTAEALYEGVCRAGETIRFPRAVVVRGWRVAGASRAGITLVNGDGNVLLTDEGRDAAKKNTVARLVPETTADGFSVDALVPTENEPRLTVYGVSFALSPVKKYRAAECGGTRNPGAVKHPDGSVTLPVAEGQGHDLYGFVTPVPAGYITFSMKLRVAARELASLPDHAPLFEFDPVFLNGDQKGRVLTVGDYLAAPADGDGFRTLSDTFRNTSAGRCEGRITSFRAAEMEVLDFIFYSGKP